MRILSCAPALDAAVPIAAASAVALARRSNFRRFAENMSSLLPVSFKRSFRNDEKNDVSWSSRLLFPLPLPPRRPGLGLASTLRFLRAMDGSGKILYIAGDPPYGTTLAIDRSDRPN